MLGGFVFGALGGVIGLLVGAARGSRDVYEVKYPGFVLTGPPGSVTGPTVHF